MLERSVTRETMESNSGHDSADVKGRCFVSPDMWNHSITRELQKTFNVKRKSTLFSHGSWVIHVCFSAEVATQTVVRFQQQQTKIKNQINQKIIDI
jgi:hypothetical protein